jgi:hypothetical protein
MVIELITMTRVPMTKTYFSQEVLPLTSQKKER